MSRGWTTLISLLIVLVASMPMGASAADPECRGWVGVDSGAETGAQIFLDGQKVEQVTPSTLKNIPCGKHTIEIKKRFFKAEKSQVEIKAEDVAKVSFTLRTNAGSLDVDTVPSGAEILINGKSVGKTPLKLKRAEAGTFKLTARLADHGSVERKVTIRSGKKAALSVKLVPQFGILTLTTRQGYEALVHLDGDPLGTTPLTLNRVAAGMHKVRLTCELCMPFETKVKVRAGKTSQVKAKMKPNSGTLIIQSRPDGARISIAGKEVGVAPLTIKLAPGMHEITAFGQAASHGQTKVKTNVKKGARRKLVVKLPVKMGSLMIDTVPFAGSIEIDGKKRGKAPLSLKDVPVGNHVLLARAPGLPPLAGRIRVVEGKRSVVEMNIKEPNKSVFNAPPAPEPVAVVSPKPVVKPAPKKQVEKKPEPKPVKKPTKAAAADDSTKDKEAAKDGSAPTEDPDVKAAIKANKGSSGDSEDTEVTAQAAAPISFQRVAAWSTGGIAVAAAVTGIVMVGLGYSYDSDADKAYTRWLNNDGTEKEFRDLDKKAADYKNVAWGCLGGMAVMGALSAVLFLTEPEPEVDVTGPRDGIMFTPLLEGGGYLGYQTRF